MKDYLLLTLCLTVFISILGMHPFRSLIFSACLAAALMFAFLASADGLVKCAPGETCFGNALISMIMFGVAIFTAIV